MDVETTIRARLGNVVCGGWDRIRFWAFDKKGDTCGVAQQLEFKEQISRFQEAPSFLELDKTSAQVLMDDLWQCGLRPSEGTGSAGQLAATQKHLSDLHKIVFHKLGIKE